MPWPDGTIGQVYSASDPEGLRGSQFGVAWLDELAKWRYLEETWDMIQFCLRLGNSAICRSRASTRWQLDVVEITARPTGNR
ncbi:MAG: terminase large subunit domain-containing protein [Rhizobiaceae bacterium]